MKKLFALLLAAMMLLSATFVPASASGTGTSWGEVPLTADEITLDGVKDAIYDQGLIIPVETVREADKELSATGKAYFLYTEKYMYVFIEVKDEWLKPVDDSLKNHLVDGTELSLDWDNDGVDAGKYVTWYNGKVHIVNGFATNDPGAEIVAKQTSDKSYTVEYKLNLPEGVKAGSAVTTYIHINNNTEAGDRVMVRAPQSANSGSNNLANTDYVVLSATKTVTAKAPASTADVEGTAITTAEQFSKMKANGKYYLANDITITNSTNYLGAFTGIFDGNGKTITTSVPLFAELGGTVKNLTINGNITIADDAEVQRNSAIAQMANGTVVVDNVVINTNLIGGNAVGGVVAWGKAGSDITITNVIMNGNITDGKIQVGSLVGYAEGRTLTIDNCVNNGTIALTDTSVEPYKTNMTGGLIGRFGDNNANVSKYLCKITNSVNNGNVTGGNYGGGIIGFGMGAFEIDGCVNKGDVNSGNYHAAGIFAYPHDHSEVGIKITNSYNYGNITGIRRAGGIIASLGTADTPTTYQIINCGNYGTITGIAVTNANNNFGGIAGYMWGGSTGNAVINSFNVGDIIVKDPNVTGKIIYAAGILGYYNTQKAGVKNCFNAGKITVDPAAKNVKMAQVFFNKNGTGSPAEYVANNYALAVEGASYEVNGTQPASVTTFTADELASGAVAYALNQAAGKTIYYQTIGTDAAPTNKNTSKEVLKTSTGYANEAEVTTTAVPVTTKAPETTKVPATTKAPAQTPATADTSIVAATLLLMVAVVAVSLKKKAK